jgi:hypothetical protein
VEVKSGLPITIKDGEIRLLPDTVLGVNYGLENPPQNLRAVAVEVGGINYFLAYSADTRAYKTSFMAPSAPGEYGFKVVFLNAENEVFFEKDFKLRIAARGRVLARSGQKWDWRHLSWEGLRCRGVNFFGGSDARCQQEAAVAGAEVKIWRKNSDGVWEVWNAREFHQENPLWTDAAGAYGAFVPEGEYELEVKKEGFLEKKVAFTVEDNILGPDIRLEMKKDFKYVIIIVVISLALLLILIRRKLLRHRE